MAKIWNQRFPYGIIFTGEVAFFVFIFAYTCVLFFFACTAYFRTEQAIVLQCKGNPSRSAGLVF